MYCRISPLCAISNAHLQNPPLEFILGISFLFPLAEYDYFNGRQFYQLIFFIVAMKNSIRAHNLVSSKTCYIAYICSKISYGILSTFAKLFNCKVNA